MGGGSIRRGSISETGAILLLGGLEGCGNGLAIVLVQPSCSFSTPSVDGVII